MHKLYHLHKKILHFNSAKTFLLFSLITFIHFHSVAQNKNEIIWKEGERLSWKDFQGKPEPRFAAASTTYKLVAKIGSEDKKTIFIIRAVFFKDQSWKKTKWINESVLSHEQTHYDIVELFARKLRQKTSLLSATTSEELEKRFLSLYGQTDQEMDEFQDLYDNETDGSMNGEKQREWEKKIKTGLDSLNMFKNESVSLSPTQ